MYCRRLFTRLLSPVDEYYFDDLKVLIKTYSGRSHWFAEVCYDGDCEEYIALKNETDYNTFIKIIKYLALEPIYHDIIWVIDKYEELYDEYRDTHYKEKAEDFKKLLSLLAEKLAKYSENIEYL